MEYIHTIKKYTVLLTTEEILECDNLKVLYDEIRRRIRWSDEKFTAYFYKILNGGKPVLKNRRHSSKWERNNPFPIFYFRKNI